ncbi:MAG: cell division protein FtsL [Pikeienuella sp.]
MRGALYLVGVAMIVAMAFWSYRMNYETQDRVELVRALQRDIVREREAITVLQAEWAYLNAPERLARLADEHRGELGLGPMTPEIFAHVSEVAEPSPDDGLEPIAIIDLDDVAPYLSLSPSPQPRPARVRKRNVALGQ